MRRSNYAKTQLLLYVFGGALTGASLVVARPAHAQQYGIDPNASTATIESMDLVTGQNKPGPYSLAWNHFLADYNHPIDVSVDGLELTADGYAIDAIKGTITFANPLKAGSLARVQYYYDPTSAKRNSDFTQSPLAVPLVQAAGTNLQLTALPDGVSGTGSTQFVYGLDRQTNLLGGGLSTKAQFADGGSATNVGYKYGTDKNGVNATFQQIDRQFSMRVGKALNLKTPQEQLGLAGHLQPAKYLGLGLTSTDTHDLLRGSDTSVHGLAMALGGAAPTQPLVNFSQTQTSTNLNSVTTNVTADKMDLAARLGAVTALTAKADRTLTDQTGSPTSATTAQDATVALNAVSKDKTKLASVSLTDADTSTSTANNHNQDLQVKVQPAPIFTLAAETKDQKSTPIGTATGAPTDASQTSVTAVVTPVKTAKVTGSVESDTAGEAHTQVTDLAAAVGTGKAIELGGGLTDRADSTPGDPPALDTKRATLALRPFKAFTLSTGYTWNPVTAGKPTDAVRQDVGLNAQLGALNLGSTYSLTTFNNLNLPDDLSPQYGQVALTLGVRLDKVTALKGNYQDSMVYGGPYTDIASLTARAARVYGFGLTRTIGTSLSVTMDGSVTENYAITSDAPLDYKAEAKIGAKF